MRPSEDTTTQEAARLALEAAILGGALGDGDWAILELLLDGRRDKAFTLLMSRYGDEIYEYCRKKLGNRDLAADVRQQVFIDAYRDLPSFRGRSTLRAWLYGIARHRVLDAAKKRRREDSYLSPKNMAAVPSLEATPEARLDEARLCDAVVKCLKATTKKRAQQTVLLRFHRGLSYDDMAVILRERPNTLRVRIRRTLQALRRSVEARAGR